MQYLEVTLPSEEGKRKGASINNIRNLSTFESLTSPIESSPKCCYQCHAYYDEN